MRPDKLGPDAFPDSNEKRLFELSGGISQLEKLGNFWIGSDVAIEKPAVVKPGQFLYSRQSGVNIILNKNNLPPVDITRGLLSPINLSLSVRSFYAQSGIEIFFHHSEMTNEMIKDLNKGKDVAVPVSVKNHGQRSVEVDGNVMRFFWKGKRLEGNDLLGAIKSGKFSVEGTEGEDWFLKGREEDENYTTSGEGCDKGVCVAVRLKPEKFYIPSAPEPVKKNNSKSTRDDLVELLKPIPSDMKLDFEIGETPRIKVEQNMVAVLDILRMDDDGQHIYSPLVDSGSDWPIRTETLGRPKYVYFYLYKK
jgi:hypothetical protein